VSRLVLIATSLAIFGSIIAVPTTAWAVPVPWKNCGSAGDAITIQRLNASVWPPLRGETLTLSSSWTLSEPLTKGSRENVSMTWPSGRVSSSSLPFQPPVGALFDYALFGHRSTNEPSSLPMAAGPYSQNLTLMVPHKKPDQPPREVDMAAFDAYGHQILCMELIVPIK
jgi:hypothetical protein